MLNKAKSNNIPTELALKKSVLTPSRSKVGSNKIVIQQMSVRAMEASPKPIRHLERVTCFAFTDIRIASMAKIGTSNGITIIDVNRNSSTNFLGMTGKLPRAK